MSAPFLSNARRIGLALALLGAAAVYWLHYQERENVYLLLGAGPADGQSFALAEAISEVVRRYHPRIQILVVPSRGSDQNAQLLASGGLDLAIIQTQIRTPPAARLIAPLFADAFQLLGGEGSGIRSPGQLEGKIVALPSAGSAGFAAFWLLASHYGLDESKLTALPMSPEAATWAMRSGAVDALFLSRPPGSPTVRKVIEGGNAYLVPIDQAAALRLNWPALEVGMIPMGSYRGDPAIPPADLTTAAVHLLLTGREELDPRLIRNVTKILFERRKELMEISPLAASITAPDLAAGTFLPVHDGAQRFYDRESPSFLQENAEVIALLLSLGVFGLSSLFRMAQQGRRRHLEAYNSELLSLYSNVKESGDRAALAEAKEETLQVLVRVLDDAEEGKVTEEGFQVFSLTWEAVYRALQDRFVPESQHPPPEQARGTGKNADGPPPDDPDKSDPEPGGQV